MADSSSVTNDRAIVIVLGVNGPFLNKILKLINSTWDERDNWLETDLHAHTEQRP